MEIKFLRKLNSRLLEKIVLPAGLIFISYSIAQTANWFLESKLARIYYTMSVEEKKESHPLVREKKVEKKSDLKNEQWREIVKIDPFNVIPDEKAEQEETKVVVEETPLNVKLLGTVAGESPEDSWAIIKDEKGQTGVYRVGDEFAVGVTIASINTDSIIVVRGGKKEKLMLYEHEEKGAGGRKSTPFTKPNPLRPPVSAKPSSGGTSEITVFKEDESHFVIEADDVNKAMSDLGSILTQARVVPYIRDGKTQGFKIFAVRPGSIFDKIGLKNGDVIKSVNGMQIKSVQEALSVFRQLKEETEFEITIERGGQVKTFYYRLR